MKPMLTPYRWAVASSVALAATLGAGSASAHIDLLVPEARSHGTGAADPDVDDNSDQKSRPCGQVENGRTERVATYAPGDTISVVIREEIDHESYIRISLNPDGDDFPYRPEEALAPASDDPETEEAAIDAEGMEDGMLLGVFEDNNSQSNGELMFDVQLPEDVECDNCTLQVIQFMYNRAQPYYYQCADITIAAAGAMDGSAGSASMGMAGSSDMGAAGSDMGAAGSDMGAGGSGMGAAGSQTMDDMADGDDDGGCAVGMGVRPSAGHWLSLLLLGAGLARRRRRR